MVMLMATITAVTTIAAGLFVLCGTVFASAGWTAPACLGAGIASGIDLILSIVSDATSGSTAESANDPDPSSRLRSRAADSVKWFKLHDDGFMEAYSGRLHDLYGTNESHTLIDIKRGYTHTVSTKNNHTRVVTDFTNGLGSTRKQRRQAESPVTGRQSRRRQPGGLARRLTSSESAAELTSAVYDAQKVGSTTASATESSADAIGTDIANGIYSLGTWCTSILDGSEVIADIGLTLNGPEYQVVDDEPPCMATAKKRSGKVL